MKKLLLLTTISLLAPLSSSLATEQQDTDFTIGASYEGSGVDIPDPTSCSLNFPTVALPPLTAGATTAASVSFDVIVTCNNMVSLNYKLATSTDSTYEGWSDTFVDSFLSSTVAWLPGIGQTDIEYVLPVKSAYVNNSFTNVAANVDTQLSLSVYSSSSYIAANPSATPALDDNGNFAEMIDFGGTATMVISYN